MWDWLLPISPFLGIAGVVKKIEFCNRNRKAIHISKFFYWFLLFLSLFFYREKAKGIKVFVRRLPFASLVESGSLTESGKLKTESG